MTAEWSAPDYEEIRRLGAGATGRVVLARHRVTGGLCAVKYLDPLLAYDPAFVERFRREAALLASIRDPHVVRLYDFVEVPGGVALVMEAVDGPTLRTLLGQGPRTPEAALAVLRGSLLGLAAAHGLGVVHRDYKPENVLVDAAGESKLADFGVAAPVGGEVGATGTPAYMAPEQWNGWPAAPATDMYAAAAVFYETLTGTRPYASDTLAGLRQQHESAPLPLDGVPPELRPMLERGLAKYPQQRHSDARVFLGELESAAVAGYGSNWLERGARDLTVAAAVMIAAFPLLASAAGGGAAAGASAVGGAGAAGAAGAAGSAGVGAGAASAGVAQGAATAVTQSAAQAVVHGAAQSAAQGAAQAAAQSAAEGAAQAVHSAAQAGGHAVGHGAAVHGSVGQAGHAVGHGAAIHGSVGQVGQAGQAGHGIGHAVIHGQAGATGRRAVRLGRHGAKLMSAKGAVVAVTVVAAASAGTAIAVTASGSSSAGGRSAGADQRAVAARETQAYQLASKGDLAGICPMLSTRYLGVFGGLDGCRGLIGVALGFGGADPQVAPLLKGVTVDPSQVVVRGDHATVPMSAIRRDGAPVSAGGNDFAQLSWVLEKGQWVMDPGVDVLPSNFPSDFPTDLPSNFPTSLSSNFPSDIPTPSSSDSPTVPSTDLPSITDLPSDSATSSAASAQALQQQVAARAEKVMHAWGKGDVTGFCDLVNPDDFAARGGHDGCVTYYTGPDKPGRYPKIDPGAARATVDPAKVTVYPGSSAVLARDAVTEGGSPPFNLADELGYFVYVNGDWYVSPA